MKYILGLDIEGIDCAVILAAVHDEIDVLKRVSIETLADRGFEQIWERLCEVIDEVLDDMDGLPGFLDSIGVSCAGPLDSKKGVVLCPDNLPGWVNIPIVKKLEDRYGVPAFLQNDSNAYALVEWAIGAGNGCRNMLYITMGTGFGCGVIANGQLITGANDMCGEVGHIRLADDGPVGFGKAGSIEGLCSGIGISQLIASETRKLIECDVIPGWVRDDVPKERYNVKMLMQYAENGDPDAIKIWSLIGGNLGRALALLIDAFNPERIVIGNIFVRAEKFLRPEMERLLAEEAIGFSLNACKIVPASTGERLGDFASIMTACYAQGYMLDGRLDIRSDTAIAAGTYLHDRVKVHYYSLLNRCPELDELNKSIWGMYKVLYDCFKSGGKLLLCGDGDSTADCETMAGELMNGYLLRRPVSSVFASNSSLRGEGVLLQEALPAISLTGQPFSAAASANDAGTEMVFAQQVYGLGRRGDVVLGISKSGNDEKVIRAIRVAKAAGLATLGLTGESGGEILNLCDICICTPASEAALVQQLHSMICNTLCAMLEAAFFDK
ncbi:MAG: ROK family protein [Oscillospiraceae bacterium]|nr:ROK family protein [Oscillospiraceae bacterium]